MGALTEFWAWKIFNLTLAFRSSSTTTLSTAFFWEKRQWTANVYSQSPFCLPPSLFLSRKAAPLYNIIFTILLQHFQHFIISLGVCNDHWWFHLYQHCNVGYFMWFRILTENKLKDQILSPLLNMLKSSLSATSGMTYRYAISTW